MREINVKTIFHKDQAYDTCGNWWWDKKGNLHVRVSRLGPLRVDEFKEFAVVVHEMIEAYHCMLRGVKQSQVDAWDNLYEASRPTGVMTCGCKIKKTSEPGNDKHAPYYFQHRFATEIEKMLVKKFGITWKDHEKSINAL